MKNLLKFLITCLFISSSLIALEVPKPIKGTPSLISKEYSIGVGSVLFTFKLPPGWGLGNISAQADSPSYFTLFPQKGGFGCSIKVTRFDNDALANDAVQQMKKNFKKVSTLGNGFEAELKSAWFSCTSNSQYLVQIWYSLPKKQKNSYQIWKDLKQSMVISPIQSQPAPNSEANANRSPIEKTFNGWVCHHPANKVDVFFETFPLINASLKEDASQLYLLKFSGTFVSGYFYIKWDQNDLTTNAPFEAHIQEILQDIKKFDSSQKIGTPTYDLAQGYGYADGNPYRLITVKGDGFLFGFAFKPSLSFASYDVNDLVKLVKWKNL